jgi:hypothetical protein
VGTSHTDHQQEIILVLLDPTTRGAPFDGTWPWEPNVFVTREHPSPRFEKPDSASRGHGIPEHTIVGLRLFGLARIASNRMLPPWSTAA